MRLPGRPAPAPTHATASSSRADRRILRAFAAAALACAALMGFSATAQAQTEVWSGTLTVQSIGGVIFGCSNDSPGSECSTTSILSDDDFTYDSTDYTIPTIFLTNTAQLQLYFTTDLAAAAQTLTLDVAGMTFAFEDATTKAARHRFWSRSGLSWSGGDTLALKLTEKTPTVPGAPVLTATANGETQIDLSWTVPDTGGRALDKYSIDVSADGGTTWGPQADVGSTITTYSHTGLTGGTTRHYRVAAVNPIGTGAWSNVDSATTTVAATAPGVPRTLTATPGDGEVTLRWTAPASDGGETITSYEYRSKATSATNFPATWTSVGTARTATVGSLTNGTPYSFEVRAVNTVGDGTAATASATPTAANNAPTFTEGTSTTRSIAENTASSQNIGTAIAATDADSGDTLRYTLGGTDMASFAIVSTSGQLQTKAALDYETKSSYAVTVAVLDGNGGSDSIDVTITVTDVDEQPATPAAPTVSATANSHTSLEVSWTAPSLNGGPALTGYDLQYRPGTSGSFTNGPQNVSGTSTAIAGLTAGTAYQVQVRALNGETPSDWSPSGTGSTSSATNNAPTFTDGASTTRSVAENTASSQNIGTAIAATDADGGDTLRYTLGGTDMASFAIVSTSGQLQTRAALDYETKSSYAVTVSVSDGNGGSDSISVTITVTDVNEQPGRPAAPSVGATANVHTSLDVSWTAPGLNGGPAITGYHLQYRQGTTGSFTNGPQNVSGTSAMITGLTAGTSYQVQVRALNGETPSDWSPSGTGSSSTPGQPTLTLDVGPNRFSEAAGSVQICVVPSAPSNQRITVQVATADGTATAPDDYGAHSGTVAVQPQQQRACFTVTLVDDADAEGDETFTVTLSNPVNATLGTPVATFTIVDNDDGANVAPTFTEGTSTTRSVAENTATGQAIGAPVAATDADSGDTLEYTLAGTDKKSFGIHLNTGQLLTQAALDFETKSSYAVSISVSDGNGGTDSIEVAITVTDVDEQPPPPPLAPPPPAPRVTVTSGDQQLTVDWGVVPGATAYTVQWKSGSEEYGRSRQQRVRASSATISGLTNGTPYTVRVAASNEGGSSGWSAEATGTPQAPPGVPTEITVTPGDRSLLVRWSAVPGAARYTLQWKTESEEYRSRRQRSIETPYAAIGHLTNAVPYTVRVRAGNASGESDWSAEASGTPESESVPVPALPAAGALGLALLLLGAARRVLRSRGGG